ncbi:MAG TPA: hypothetical protein DIS79_07050 [Bacteroidetes bacterium]|nr:hypothetical protein [Bacteroidota bacterium]HRK04288.1 SDR family oxidoreductase [Chlorobiota bacterium]
MPTVFVTGGARRIGRGLIRRFAERGWDVGITFQTSAEAALTTRNEVLEKGVRCHITRVDVSDAPALERAMADLVDELGMPDAIVSNAGVFPDAIDPRLLEPDAVRSAIDVNTMPLLTLAKYYDSLAERTGSHGRLVAIASLGAFEIWKDRLAYNVSKSALVTMVRSLARSMAPRLSVNAVAPGAIVFPDDPTSADLAVSKVDRIPMGRYGTADDVFDAVWMFSSASTYITGQVLSVDGGYGLTR